MMDFAPKLKQIIIDSSSGSEQDVPSSGEGDACRVCGQDNAQMHYGALACVGCKGFFRRALKKADQLECLGSGTCTITKDARTNCRSCRLRACLEAGMNPAAVRPDRDFTGRQRKTKKAPERKEPPQTDRIASTSDDWNKRLSVEMRTMLMRLLNLEAKISRGDTNEEIANLYPLKVRTLREILEDPSKLKGKRSVMRYERDRLCKNHELSPIAYRRLIAAIDWVEYLSEYLPERLSVEDRIALVKGCFLPLLVFKVSARTAVNTENENVMCMCNFSYIPRDIGKLYDDCYHWNNGLVDRVLDGLVAPYRKFGLKEEEIVCMSAIVVLNPLYKDLSEKASDMVMDLRNKIQDTLFAVMREGRPGQASVLFGNLLLSLPTVWTLANEMNENLVFAQTFSTQQQMPLMSNLFGCFPVEPFNDEWTEEERAAIEVESMTLSKKSFVDRDCQTDPVTLRALKRRVPPSFTSPVEAEPRKMPFSLRQPPSEYTLAEMFDDLEKEQFSPLQPSCSFAVPVPSHPMAAPPLAPPPLAPPPDSAPSVRPVFTSQPTSSSREQFEGQHTSAAFVPMRDFRQRSSSQQFAVPEQVAQPPAFAAPSAVLHSSSSSFSSSSFSSCAFYQPSEAARTALYRTSSYPVQQFPGKETFYYNQLLQSAPLPPPLAPQNPHGPVHPLIRSDPLPPSGGQLYAMMPP